MDSACNVIIICNNNKNSKQRKPSQPSRRPTTMPASLQRQQAAALRRRVHRRRSGSSNDDHCCSLHDIDDDQFHGSITASAQTMESNLRQSPQLYAYQDLRRRYLHEARKQCRRIEPSRCPSCHTNLSVLCIEAVEQLTHHAPVSAWSGLPQLSPSSPRTISPFSRDLRDLPVAMDHVACNDCHRCFNTTDSLHQHQWDSPGHTRVSRWRVARGGLHACSQCAAEFRSASDLEEHYVKQHPITEICKSDSEGTWQHLEERFRAGWKSPSVNLDGVHGFFKIYNPGWRLWDFEEYRKELKRDMEKSSCGLPGRNKSRRKGMEQAAGGAPMAHRGSTAEAVGDEGELRRRVLHDGNQINNLYHGTSIRCLLGQSAAAAVSATGLSTSQVAVESMFAGKQYSLCEQPECKMCSIVKGGFKKSKCRKNRFQRFGNGIYCSSVSSKANSYVDQCRNVGCSKDANLCSDDGGGCLKAMLACKVLAGRPFHSAVNRPELGKPPLGFHSVHGDKGLHLNYEELVLYDDRAILPGYLILYSSSTSKK